MSEAITRDLNGATASARRVTSQSMTFLKGAAAWGKGDAEMPTPMPMPANEAAAPRSASDPSVVSARTVMVGSIATEDELHIHGRVDGQARAAKITVCAGGFVKGDVTADTIVIHGAVEGRVHGKHVRLCAGAIVKGEIHHCTLGIDTAAIFEGTVKRVEMAEAVEMADAIEMAEAAETAAE